MYFINELFQHHSLLYSVFHSSHSASFLWASLVTWTTGPGQTGPAGTSQSPDRWWPSGSGPSQQTSSPQWTFQKLHSKPGAKPPGLTYHSRWFLHQSDVYTGNLLNFFLPEGASLRQWTFQHWGEGRHFLRESCWPTSCDLSSRIQSIILVYTCFFWFLFFCIRNHHPEIDTCFKSTN